MGTVSAVWTGSELSGYIETHSVVKKGCRLVCILTIGLWFVCKRRQRSAFYVRGQNMSNKLEEMAVNHTKSEITNFQKGVSIVQRKNWIRKI